MEEPYLPRTLEPALRRALAEFPVVLLGGPRQSGKTTLARHVLEEGRLGGRGRYVSLESPDVRAAALADPRGFLGEAPPTGAGPLVLDEVQHAPELLSYVQEAVDADRKRKGRFLLTGSQNLLLMERVSQTLAGRVAILTLLPLSWREQAGTPGRPFPWERLARDECEGPVGSAWWPRFVRGGFPELVVEPARDGAAWHSAYQRTYLERDLRTLRQVGDLTSFAAFLRLLAARSASLLNVTSLSRDLGVAVNTVKAWLSVLEASWQVVVVRPWQANLRKRLVKQPKVYFTDLGVLCHLVGLTDPRHAAQGPMAGAIAETAVLSELVKGQLHRGLEPRVHFWRTSTGEEVDFLVEHEGRLVPIEVKATSTPNPGMAQPMRALRDDLGASLARGFLVHLGGHRLPLGDGILALPLRDL